VIVAFIDDNRNEFGVEPIVRALSGTAARIAVSSYYAFKKRHPSARARRDQALMVVIQDVYEANYSCYGVRKMWKAINRDYADQFGPLARCTVERLMRQLGIDGIRRKRKRPKTASARAEECPDDLVEREFTAPGPNCVWVADITYVPTQVGWVYTTFILDVFHREIVGWQVIRPGNNGDSEATERTSLSCPKRNTPSSSVREQSGWFSTRSKPTPLPAAESSAASATNSA